MLLHRLFKLTPNMFLFGHPKCSYDVSMTSQVSKNI